MGEPPNKRLSSRKIPHPRCTRIYSLWSGAKSRIPSRQFQGSFLNRRLPLLRFLGQAIHGTPPAFARRSNNGRSKLPRQTGGGERKGRHRALGRIDRILRCGRPDQRSQSLDHERLCDTRSHIRICQEKESSRGYRGGRRLPWGAARRSPDNPLRVAVSRSPLRQPGRYDPEVGSLTLPVKSRVRRSPKRAPPRSVRYLTFCMKRQGINERKFFALSQRSAQMPPMPSRL